MARPQTPHPALAARVAALRAFNRFWTKQIGVLGAGLHDTSYSLTEARVLFELAQNTETEVSTLKRDLGLDPGYLSRILRHLKTAQLVTQHRSQADQRRHRVRLTAKGQRVFRSLDTNASRAARTLMNPLPDDAQQRLVDDMASIQSLLSGAPAARACVLRGLGPGDLGWVVERHGVLYAREYAWDESFEALVARIVSEYVEGNDQHRNNAWIAELDGAPVGCVFCVQKSARVAQLRLLLVEPRARGLGVGTTLVDECIRFARGAGYRKIVLWTNHPLRAARRIYERAGFRLVGEEPHRSFGHQLVGQNFSLTLTEEHDRESRQPPPPTHEPKTERSSS